MNLGSRRDWLLLGLVLVLVAGYLVVDGLTSQRDRTSEPTAQTSGDRARTSVERTSTTLASAGSRYLALVRPSAPAVSDQALVTLAKSACGALDDGATVEQIALEAAQYSDTVADLRDWAFIVGAGVGAYCPEHTDKLRTG